MNLTCFYCQTPFTLSMDQKIAALRKMHAENLHHYDAHCPRCGRANAISRERLEMFTPGWEEAIKEPAMAAAMPGGGSNPPNTSHDRQMPNAGVPTPVPAEERREPEDRMAMKRATPARKRHAPAARKAAAKSATKKAPAKKKAATKKKTAAKTKKTTPKSRSKSSSRKTARKSR